jgi:hypothetical protein
VAYEVVFDVSERLPQLAVGVVAAVVLLVVIAGGLWSIDAVLACWLLVLGVGAGLLAIQGLLGHEWPYVLALGVAVAVIVALESAGRPEDDDRPSARRMPHGAGGLGVGAVALVLAAVVGLPMIGAIDLERRLLDGYATVVEGPVTVEDRGESECVVVDAERFCYSDGIVQAGYNRRRTVLGAPFTTGDQVRLSIIGDQIVRIEVAAAS